MTTRSAPCSGAPRGQLNSGRGAGRRRGPGRRGPGPCPRRRSPCRPLRRRCRAAAPPTTRGAGPRRRGASGSRPSRRRTNGCARGRSPKCGSGPLLLLKASVLIFWASSRPVEFMLGSGAPRVASGRKTLEQASRFFLAGLPDAGGCPSALMLRRCSLHTHVDDELATRRRRNNEPYLCPWVSFIAAI